MAALKQPPVNVLSKGAGYMKAVLFGPKKDTWLVAEAGVPVDGTSGTCTWASPGSILVDTTNFNLYINAGTAGSPVWKLVTRAA